MAVIETQTNRLRKIREIKKSTMRVRTYVCRNEEFANRGRKYSSRLEMSDTGNR